MKTELIQIGLRVPLHVNEELERRAKELWVTKNALIVMLIDLGQKAYDGAAKLSQL